MLEEKMAALSAGLPEDILKKKWAGDFEGAKAMIEYRLAHWDLTPMMRDALEVEREALRRLPGQYPHSREKALAMVREKVPDFSDEEFDRLELEGALDFIYIRGERHYYRRFLNSLLYANAAFRARAGLEPHEANPMLDETIAALKKEGCQRWHTRMRHTLRVKDEAFIPGETYLAHLPLPRPCAQVEKVRVIDPAPDACIGPESQPQRTAAFRRRLEENAPFSVEYEYDTVLRYVDPLAVPAGRMPVYPNEPSPTPADLAESLPHIRFSPYIKSLAEEIRGEEREPVRVARRVYDYVTQKVKYSFMREYFLVDDGAGYAALNRKGDCGIQALLFITLCRCLGIPARWQSGMYTPPDGPGNHDWALFYAEPFGWLFSDCSFGGSAWRAGALERWNFYFGNLDPYRMPANCAYGAALEPTKAHFRIDPYDNQCGEAECGSRGFDDAELSNFNFELLELRQVKG